MIHDAGARRAAAILGEARDTGSGVAPLPDDCTPETTAEAYVVQGALHRWFTEADQGALAGYKVGATTQVMQEMLGIPHPAYGHVMTGGVHSDQGEFTAGRFRNLGIECEIAVRMASNTDATRTDHDRDAIAEHIGACMPAMEIVDNRHGDLQSTPVAMMIADDFFHAACILGRETDAWRGLDLAAAEGRTTVDGALAGTGDGAEVMGHPFEAVAWLANALAERGERLRAGQFVLCGSLVAVQWVKNFPAEAAIEIAGLGSVSARFA